MKCLLPVLLALVAGCADAERPAALDSADAVRIDTAAIWQEAEACAAAWVAEHGGLPTTLRAFAGIESNCQRALFMQLEPAKQYALWAEQLDYYAQTDSLSALQQAALANIRGMLSEAYFTLPPAERPEPDAEEIARLFGSARAAAYFYRLGSMYE